LVILRDLIIVGGALCYHCLIASFDAAPTPMSKLNTFTQLLLVLVVLVNQGLWSVHQSLVPLLVLMTAITTVLSGLGYVGVWGRRALGVRPRPRSDDRP
jgi:cardiolipin synthase